MVRSLRQTSGQFESEECSVHEEERREQVFQEVLRDLLRRCNACCLDFCDDFGEEGSPHVDSPLLTDLVRSNNAVIDEAE